MSELRLGGLTPLSTLDYPGHLSAVVFCGGCPWRCRYCHNPELTEAEASDGPAWDGVLDFLRRRRGLLDAVVFSGGEPTAQSALVFAMAQARGMGFKVALHTAGCYPGRLKALLPLIDWVGLDIKALPEDYEAVTGVPDSGAAAWESLELLVERGIAHEVRVTCHDRLLSTGQLSRLLDRLTVAGAQSVVMQSCRWQHARDASLGPTRSANQMLAPIRERYARVAVRG